MQFLIKIIKTIPCQHLLLPFILGILLQYHINLSFKILLIFTIVSFLTFIVYTVWVNYKPTRVLIWYIFSFITILLLGSLRIKIKTDEYLKNIKISEKTEQCLAIVTSLPSEKKNKQNFKIRIIAYHDGGKWHKTNYFANLTTEKKLTPGQIIFCKNLYKYPVSDQIFPFQDNQLYFLQIKNIIAKYAIKNTTDINVLGESKHIRHIFEKWRFKFNERLKQYITSKDEHAILSSLLIGYKGQLNPELRNNYAQVGVVHILSVSGMHVGLVYLLLIFLTSWIPIIRDKKTSKQILILIGIWGYSFIAGLGIPIIRASLMFSLYILGKLLKKQIFNFNILFVSAFLTLLINPIQIFDIGFQLSYSAMAGIFIFYNPLVKNFLFRYHIIKYIYNSFALALSAQLGTLPFMLYHFNFFPSLFWIANIIILPFVTIILYMGIIFAILSFTPLATIWGKILSIVIEIMNQIINHLSNLQFINLNEIYLNEFSVICLCLIILIIGYGVYNRNLIFLIWLCIAILFLQTNQLFKKITSTAKELVVVSYLYNNPFISLYKNATLMHISSTPLDENILKIYTRNFKRNFYVRNDNFISIKCLPKDTIIQMIRFVKISNDTFFIISNKNMLKCVLNRKKINLNLYKRFSDKDFLNFSQRKKHESEPFNINNKDFNNSFYRKQYFLFEL